MILTNHVIKSDRVVNQEMCKINCYLETRCVSYNYGPIDDGLLLCELNDKNHSQVSSSKMIQRSGFIYSPIFVSTSKKTKENEIIIIKNNLKTCSLY